MAFGSARNFDSMLASSTLVDKVCILQRIEKKKRVEFSVCYWGMETCL